MEYKPIYRKHPGMNIKFGYFVSPIDDRILIPDPKKIEAIEYSFKMRSKYKTSIRDCCMWLHGQTGQRMTPSGYLYAYRRWVKKLRAENFQKIAARKRQITKEREQFLNTNFNKYSIKTDDTESIQSVADKLSREEIRASQKQATG